MPIDTTSVASLTVAQVAALPAVPDAVYTALAAGEDVQIPAGSWRIPLAAPLVLTAPGQRLTGQGRTATVLCAEHAGGTAYPVRVRSFEPSAAPVGRLTGAVTAGTTSLTWVAGTWWGRPTLDIPAVGDVLHLLFGLQTVDPQEAYRTRFVTVTGVAGNLLTFDPPVGFDVPDYGSLEALTAVVLEGFDGAAQALKVGPFGTFSGSGAKSRGHGTDHDVLSVGTALLAGCRVAGFTLLYPSDFPAGDIRDTFGVHGVYAPGLVVEDVGCHDPVGSVVHLEYCDGAIIRRVVTSGAGRGYVGASTLFTCWGGAEMGVSGGVLRAAGCGLGGMERDYDVTFTDTDAAVAAAAASGIRLINVGGYPTAPVVVRGLVQTGTMPLFPGYPQGVDLSAVRLPAAPADDCPLADNTWRDAPRVYELGGGDWRPVADVYLPLTKQNDTVFYRAALPPGVWRDLSVRPVGTAPGGGAVPAVAAVEGVTTGAWASDGAGSWSKPAITEIAYARGTRAGLLSRLADLYVTFAGPVAKAGLLLTGEYSPGAGAAGSAPGVVARWRYGTPAPTAGAARVGRGQRLTAFLHPDAEITGPLAFRLPGRSDVAVPLHADGTGMVVLAEADTLALPVGAVPWTVLAGSVPVAAGRLLVTPSPYLPFGEGV